jgi:predicted nucleotidyltransferase
MTQGFDKSRLEKIVAFFVAHGVRFIVIGGQAEYLFGSPLITFDVHFCYERTHENLERLAIALKELGVSLRGAPPGLPFVVDARSLALGSNFTLNTPFGALDLLGYVEPIGTYDDLVRSATVVALGEHQVQVISLDDLIAIKRHIGRPKDRESLYQLLAIKRKREETGLK